jgi:hypothetical protein
MGHMKDLDIRIYGGGEDAIAAACELAGIVKERRGYEDTMRATSDITDIVTVLRGVGFASVPPSAGESASLLHYCVTHAADEIERLREERRWIPVGERLPEPDHMGNPTPVLVVMPGYGERTIGYCDNREYGIRWHCQSTQRPTHWQLLPSPPEVTP